MSRVDQKQIDEWTENPVTLELLKLVEHEIESTRESMADAFTEFRPQRTQEILAGLNGARDTWEEVCTALSGDWSFLETEEDDEQLGD